MRLGLRLRLKLRSNCVHRRRNQAMMPIVKGSGDYLIAG